jgi:hypothetical protein
MTILHARSGRVRRRAAVVAAALVLTFLGSAPAHSENRDGPCRIVGGFASVIADQPLPDGSFGYRGAIILFTRACGDGPKGVSGTFRPVAGSPTSCAPIAAPRIDQAACAFTGSLGIGLAGTPVAVSATGYTSGVVNDHAHDQDTVARLGAAKVQPGADQQTSECVLLVPEAPGRFGCSLF